MSRIVVVATSPVERDALADHVEPTDELVVVVPAVEQSRLDWLANDEGAARSQAESVGQTVAQAAPTDAETVEVKPDSGIRLTTPIRMAKNRNEAVISGNHHQSVGSPMFRSSHGMTP